MSRGSDYDDYGDNFPNEWAFWEHRTKTALNSKRGRKALAELREALLALPEHRLISRAMSTAGPETDPDNPDIQDSVKTDIAELVQEQGVGVCAVGAYLWHKKVNAGMDPGEAMRSLPLLDDIDSTLHDTAQYGESGGLTYTLAWTLADLNDEAFRESTPEDRWVRYMAWLDSKLGAA